MYCTRIVQWKDNHYLIKYKESPLEATATHRNKETDPNDRARVEFKVDAIFEYQDIQALSGGLPQCSRSKEWDDTRKLGLEL
ncbi:unnamed protein product [Rhizophagus irregularis]|nr:unnamed protein product [Rhizophagus irregularis]